MRFFITFLLVILTLPTFARSINIPHHAEINKIYTDANVNLRIIGGKQKFTVNANFPRYQFSRVFVRQHTLMICDIKQGCQYPHPPLVDCTTKTKPIKATVTVHLSDLHSLVFNSIGKLTVRHLTSHGLHLILDNCQDAMLSGKRIPLLAFYHHGIGAVQVKSIYTPKLSIYNDGKGSVNLSGLAHLENLDFSGTSKLNLYWVDSCNLHIHGYGQGHAFIAGKANRMVVELQGNSQLDSRYLQTQNISIKTVDHAQAKVSAIKTLNALARDESHILFYRQPQYLGMYMQQQGSVLNMTAIHLYRCQQNLPLYKNINCHLPPFFS